MTDTLIEDDNPVAGQGEAAPFVARLSRTATGTRTYTVGASIPADGNMVPMVARLFELEALMRNGLDAPSNNGGRSVLSQLRRSMLVEKLRRAGDWRTTAELMEPGAHRSQVVADLSSLVADGHLAYQRGKGGSSPSRYKLAEPAVPTAKKGKR